MNEYLEKRRRINEYRRKRYREDKEYRENAKADANFYYQHNKERIKAEARDAYQNDPAFRALHLERVKRSQRKKK